LVGKSLGPYKIIEQIGAGGMGEVYLGEDTRLGRKVAIKVLPAEYASDPERLARFEQEARAAAALNHPHIAVVHDIGSEEGDAGAVTHFIVQEVSRGGDAAGASRQGGAAAQEGTRDRGGDRRGARGGSCGRHRSPRPEAGQRLPDEGRPREGP